MSILKNRPKILVIVGPTASGKSALAIKLAKKFGGEIVSADSRQIYRGMDIGTAKPPNDSAKFKNQKSKLQFKIKNEYIALGIRHHLIDVKNPDEEYAVADYKRDAVRAMRAILRRGKLPILVGGTGLYVKAVLENLKIPEVPADPRLRRKLEKELREKGLSRLFQKLVGLDPEAAYVVDPVRGREGSPRMKSEMLFRQKPEVYYFARGSQRASASNGVDPKNPRRVIRALEVAIKTGRPFSAQRKKGAPIFDALIIGLNPPKTALRKKINARVDQMLRDGLVSEVQNLMKKYPSTSLGTGGLPRAFNAIGYHEIIDYLKGKISLSEATELMKKNTLAYAKRQMTWFKKDKKIRWIEVKNGRRFAIINKFFARRTKNTASRK